MNQSDCSIQTIFGEVGLSRQKLQDRRADYSPIDFKFSYINGLSVPVTIRMKSGFCFTLPPAPTMLNGQLIVRMEISAQDSVRESISRCLSSITDESSLELRCLREAYELQYKNSYQRGFKLSLDYPLSLGQLKQYGGSVYHSELDIVISILPQDEVPNHPFSEAGQKYQMIVGDAEDSVDKFSYSMVMIDNVGTHGPRYLNIRNRVYKVTVKKNPSLRDGVYVSSNRFVTGDQATRDIVTEFYSFDSIETSLGLYKSYDEALNFGDIVAAKKTDMTKLEVQLSENKLKLQAAGLELQSAKEAHELAMLDKNRELKELQLKHEQDTIRETKLREAAETVANNKRQETKDYYENRSHQRKDDSETIKFLPAIVVGIGAVFMAFKTFFR